MCIAEILCIWELHHDSHCLSGVGWSVLLTGNRGRRLRSAGAEDADGKLRIICFGAHPDDAEFKAGGTAAKWAAHGHHVKFVSVTNGDIGHWQRPAGRWPSGARPR